MQERPFRGSLAVARGLVTPGALRGPRFVRLYPDVYVAAGVKVTFRILSTAAFLLVEPRGGVLTGYSAAELVGSSCAPRGAPAEVLVSGHIRSHPRLRVRRGRAEGPDNVITSGCRVTSPLCTAWGLARRLELVEAVVAVDAPAFRRFEPSALLGRRAQEPGARGCRRPDRVVDLADARAESPMETAFATATGAGRASSPRGPVRRARGPGAVRPRVPAGRARHRVRQRRGSACSASPSGTSGARRA